MPQSQRLYQLELLSDTVQLVSHAGIAPFLDLLVRCGFFQNAAQMVRTRKQGWPDVVQCVGLIVLLLADGEHVDDLTRLRRDSALCKLIHRYFARLLCGDEKRAYLRARRCGALPSPSSLRRFLESFHDEKQEELRAESTVKAFIPEENGALRLLAELNASLLCYTLRCLALESLTLDMDATLAESHKSTALFCYKHFPGYQPLNVFVAELAQMLYSSFRDGNVPAGFRQLEVFQRALELLPDSVRELFLRTDTQGYEWELLRYCAEGKSERFGVIRFAIGVDVTPEFKLAAKQAQCWAPLYVTRDGERIRTDQEWAEVAFAPNALAQGRSGTRYRFIAIRERLQPELPGMPQAELPFPSFESGTSRYKLHGLVSNRFELSGDELIQWHRERCGASEHAHAEIKHALAGGSLPSGKFGANAAWWQFNVMTYNLHRMMSLVVLGEGRARRSIKTIRRTIINIAAWLQEKARSLILRVPQDRLELLRHLQRQIEALPA
jgi:hypothetical protein